MPPTPSPSFTLSSVQAYLTAVQRPSNSLGWGAGLTTPAHGQLLRSGHDPHGRRLFDPWWAAAASTLQLSYSVEDTASLTAETVPTPTVVALPTTAASLADIPLTLPAGDAAPGPYEVQATLVNTATSPPTTLGTTCMPYTVGAAGDGLNLTALPSGSGSGGPADPRGVALNAQLGLDSLRSSHVVDWGSLLPNCNPSAPTAATCGSAAMTFASATTDPYKAAYLAAQDHLDYWMQISGGDAVSTALVNNGFWQGDIAALVAHYATVPAGCGSCAPVTMWEPWNESNNTGWGNGGTYATSVLKPFYAAVKSVEPGSTSTVIGGSSLEPVLWWWQQLIAAGGLAWMDVAGVHPYTGSNDAYEEDGMPAQVRQLQALLGGKPMWFTEIGWWSDGDYNFLGQANSVARSLIWQKVLGVPVQNYFYDEGPWGNDGISFSLIQAANSDDYVKPVGPGHHDHLRRAGRAAVPVDARHRDPPGLPGRLRRRLRRHHQGGRGVDRRRRRDVAVTLTSPTGSTDPVTVDHRSTARPPPTQATSGTAYRLPVSDQVGFITYPAGDTLAVGPTETFGTDLASSAAHATATASSGTASAAIAGLTVGYGQGWTSASGDTTPTLTVSPWPRRRPSTGSWSTPSRSGSTATGVRNYTLSANEPGTGWVTVATETGPVPRPRSPVRLRPRWSRPQLRVAVTEVDFGGYYGGGIPPWWACHQTRPRRSSTPSRPTPARAARLWWTAPHSRRCSAGARAAGPAAGRPRRRPPSRRRRPRRPRRPPPPSRRRPLRPPTTTTTVPSDDDHDHHHDHGPDDHDDPAAHQRRRPDAGTTSSRATG